jgi:hypothetical protein
MLESGLSKGRAPQSVNQVTRSRTKLQITQILFQRIYRKDIYKDSPLHTLKAPLDYSPLGPYIKMELI